MAKHKHFCGKCGYKMKSLGERVSYYDRRTGKPETYELFTCPNKKWFGVFLFHESVECFGSFHFNIV